MAFVEVANWLAVERPSNPYMRNSYERKLPDQLRTSENNSVEEHGVYGRGQGIL